VRRITWEESVVDFGCSTQPSPCLQANVGQRWVRYFARGAGLNVGGSVGIGLNTSVQLSEARASLTFAKGRLTKIFGKGVNIMAANG
jgi:hypothetical protein